MAPFSVVGQPLVRGIAGVSEIVHSDVPLSFWGGVDPKSGRVCDARHPLMGISLKGKIVALPGSRGSCTASQVILELLIGDVAPAGIVLRHRDEIISLGVIVAEEFFDRSIPVVRVDNDDDYARLAEASRASIFASGRISLDPCHDVEETVVEAAAARNVELSSEDLLVEREKSSARGRAMRIVARVAEIVGAKRLVDVSRAHIDATTYIGPASLRFARALVAAGGRFKVPTTTNACSVDLGRWREIGVPPDIGEPAEALADAYVKLGAAPTFTCAPYLDDPPRPGEDLGWSESNAVAFANSVCGARTQKNADFLDACIALTGRAPLAGAHVVRDPACLVDCRALPEVDARDRDALWGLAGYVVGALAPRAVPLVTGLADVPATEDDLKNFSAAFATTSGSPLFHIQGHTPEAAAFDPTALRETQTLDASALRDAWLSLGGYDDADVDAIDLVALGSPHASLDELSRLDHLVHGRKPDAVRVVVTLARRTLEAADPAVVRRLLHFGVDFIVDTCWCMLNAPVILPNDRIVTNSAKYAHYASGLVACGRVHFAGLAGCADAALSGRAPSRRPPWLLRRATFSTTIPRLFVAACRRRLVLF